MARVLSSNVRSGPSRKGCYLRFINNTTRRVNVIWIDYHGGNRNYGTLEPNRYFDIHTYEGHPWISKDIVSKKRMKLNKKDVFYPKPQGGPAVDRPRNRHYLPVLSRSELNDDQLKREYVYITLPDSNNTLKCIYTDAKCTGGFPVFSLLERSSEVIIKSVSSKEDLKCLYLPKRLEGMLSNSYFTH